MRCPARRKCSAASALCPRAHPDHGAPADDAGQRVSDLTEAKRILLAAL